MQLLHLFCYVDHLDNDYVELKKKEASFENIFASSLIEPKDLKLLEKIGQGMPLGYNRSTGIPHGCLL